MLESGRQLGLWRDAGFPRHRSVGDEATWCRALAEYARACAQAGRALQDWRTQLRQCGRRTLLAAREGSHELCPGAPGGLRVDSGWPPRASAQCPALLRATVVRAVRPEAHLHVTEEQTGSERRDGGLGSQSQLRVGLRASQALASFLATQCSHRD